ncbi:unnamed protein product [Sphagnum tenellum]
MKTMADNSIDAIVCDPPYGIELMGVKWDYQVPSVAIWQEALRVLKPGGHMLAFSSTRTYHRMVVNVEDAGFVIRDQLGWLYGSGLPKGMNVSKAIDKLGGMSPAQQATVLKTARERSGMSREAVAEAVGCTPSSVRDWEEGRARATGASIEHITPSPQYRDVLADLLGYTSDEREITGATIDRRGDETVLGLGHSGIVYGKATTEDAKKWTGWGYRT